jgi:hypothetical protein
MFMEQRKQAELAAETQSITDINNIMMNIQTSMPKSTWRAEIPRQMSPYLNDPGTSVNAKMAILNGISRMFHTSGITGVALEGEIAQYIQAVRAMHPDVTITTMGNLPGGGYTTFQAV